MREEKPSTLELKPKSNHNLNEAEIIRRIEVDYHASYDPDSKLPAYEQLQICESLKESGYRENESVNGNVNESVNGTYKREVKFELTEDKQKAITELQRFNYMTPPKQIAQILEYIFAGSNSKPGHMLYIAQQWAPRSINRVVNNMVKQHSDGWVTIQNPAAYFTSLIKFRKKRKTLKKINNDIA